MSFEDVKSTDWFYLDVAKAWDFGIIEGKSPSIFAPKTGMTRAEFVTFLSRICKVETEGFAEIADRNFTDVNAGDWHASYVGWGVDNGIITGYNDGTFRPDNSVSRQELAVMLVRLMNFQNFNITEDKSVIAAFGDLKSIGSWARPQVEALRLTGIINGDENGHFNPKKPATRAEVAAIGCRYQEAVNDYFTEFSPEELNLELTVTYDLTVSEEMLTQLVIESVPYSDSYKSIEVAELTNTVTKLNDLGAVSRNIPIDIAFTRGAVTSTGTYILHFTRECESPAYDVFDPTPDNIGSQYFDESTGIKISESIHFADEAGNPYYSTSTGTHGGHESKVVRTPYGTFAVYLTGERQDETFDFTWDQFKVFKITSEGVNVIFEGEYPHSNGSCLPNIFAGDPGKLYVTVISCDNVKYYSDNLREGAWLDVYEIDTASGRFEKYSANPDFEIMMVHGYGYSQPIPDIKNGKIYALYTGGGIPGYLAWFVYDIDTQTWNTECFTVETDFRLAYFHMFADGNGGFYGIGMRDVLCQDLGEYLGVNFKSTGYAGDALYLFSIKDVTKEEYDIQTIKEAVYEQSDEESDVQGIGGFAYRDNVNNLHVLYFHKILGDISRYHAVFDSNLNLIMNDSIAFTDQKHNDYSFTMTQAPDGSYYIFAVNSYMSIREAKVEIWKSFDGIEYKKILSNIPLMRDADNIFNPQLKFITTSPRNNSTMDGTVGFIVFDSAFNYYYFAVEFGETSE